MNNLNVRQIMEMGLAESPEIAARALVGDDRPALSGAGEQAVDGYRVAYSTYS